MAETVKHTHWFALHSVTGMHIGLWQDGALAVKMQGENPGSTITELVELTPEVAAAPEMLEALQRAEATLELMASSAFRVGLEGTKDWDEVAGGADMHGSSDVIRAAIAKATGGQP